MSYCNIVTSGHFYQTIEQFDKTIVFPRKLATGSIHDYRFCYCPLVGILFEVLRIAISVLYIPGLEQTWRTPSENIHFKLKIMSIIDQNKWLWDPLTSEKSAPNYR